MDYSGTVFTPGPESPCPEPARGRVNSGVDLSKLPIYLDHHATTPVDPRVLEAMLPFFGADFGNAASRNHAFGWRAEAAVEAARKQVATLIGARPEELIFTSGATESNNLAIKGVLECYRHKGDHVVTVKTEHKSVLDSCRRLERQRSDRMTELRLLRLSSLRGIELSREALDEPEAEAALASDPLLARWLESPGAGARVTYLDVLPDGRVDLTQLERALTPRTVLVSVMFANNEIGTIQPIAEIGALCRQRGVLFHCDAVQGLGSLPFDVEAMNADLVSLSAHKLYGPKGVGALYVRRKPRVRLAPLLDGGGQERSLRAGTLNVPGIVGFGRAAQLAVQERAADAQRLSTLRDRLRSRLEQALEGVHINGTLEHRLPGNLNVSFEGVDGEALMMALKDVAISSGSACSSASLEPSYVLRACGLDEELAHGSVRFGLGRSTTAEEVDLAADRVVKAVSELRAKNPLYEPRHAPASADAARARP